MKVAIISNLYPPIARGGAERIASRIGHELHVRGHEVVSISTKQYEGKDSIKPQIYERDVEPVYRFFPPNLYHLINDRNYPFPVRAIWHLIDMFSPYPRKQVREILGHEKPDLVITHNLKGIGFQIPREIRALGIPHIHTVHDVQMAIPSGLLISGKEKSFLNSSFLQTWYQKTIKKIIGSPNHVFCPSKFLADFHKDRGYFNNSEVEVLPNPAPKLKALNRWPYEPRVLRIIIASQLEDHKGIRFLKEILDEFDLPFELHIAGDGSLSDFVIDWTKHDDRVTYHGFVSLQNLVGLFELSDVVVVPSLCYEGSPTIMYESLQAGIPVIAADIGGVGELVKDGVNGYLVQPGDKAAWKDAFTKMAQGVHHFHNNADQIRATVEPYAMDHYVDRLEEVMEQLKAKNAQ